MVCKSYKDLANIFHFIDCYAIFKHTCSFIVYYRLSGVSLSNKTTVFRLPSVLR